MQQYDSQVLPQVKQKSKAEPVYVMIDGSMIYTREEGWKEIKLGRIHARGQVTEIIRYYETHEDRMQYKSFSDKGYMIGSGPIESAHKSVIQQRMKLSGQRWSIQGVQAIADLRCAYSSNNHDCIKYLIKMAA